MATSLEKWLTISCRNWCSNCGNSVERLGADVVAGLFGLLRVSNLNSEPRGITVALANFQALFDSCWCVRHWNDHRAENQELHCVALCRVRLVTREQVHPRIFERTI